MTYKTIHGHVATKIFQSSIVQCAQRKQNAKTISCPPLLEKSNSFGILVVPSGSIPVTDTMTGYHKSILQTAARVYRSVSPHHTVRQS